ncbi:MAG TPA: isoprenylcysteine carboxylmethyltransferase family protein [Microlunatus sp.]
MDARWWFSLLVLLVAGERIAELAVARRNRRRALAAGGIEYGAGHYPVIVALQVGLLAGSVLEVWLRDPPIRPILSGSMLVLLLLAQGLRWWCIATLGPQWNTRIIVVPGLGRRRWGPYRWIPHPNYLAVVVEGIALPLIGSAWITAIAFTAANSALLGWRIRVENRALLRLTETRQP